MRERIWPLVFGLALTLCLILRIFAKWAKILWSKSVKVIIVQNKVQREAEKRRRMYKDREKRSVFFLERRIAVKPVKIKTIQSQVKRCITFFFFFFLISKNVIYTNDYSMHEEHRANPKNTRRRKQRKNIKENQSAN